MSISSHFAPRVLCAALLAGVVAAPASLAAQRGTQPIDSAYTARIIELTPKHERWKFITELVDYLPASGTVPTPLEANGYVPGTEGRLSRVADINRYFRAVDAASPRTKLWTIGTSDEGREMILMAFADEQTIQQLPRYQAIMDSLADPRVLTPESRERLIREAKPIYWLTGAIHSGETGSPEMLMELAYRLAVDEGEHIRAIREKAIVLITPVIETDGRDRYVDTYYQNKELGVNTPLVYWGKYTAHDNNRDGMVVSQRLTRSVNGAFDQWKPVVFHDLHESVPFLYASTGSGPYNEQFDAILVSEWHQLAYQEITELTRRGLPGVWTHRFYDGWTPNYMFSVANFRNSIGRFYETYTSRGADCHTVQLGQNNTSREWFRANPPVNGVRWCIRSNINYQQSGVLVALRHVADNADTFLRNFVAKGENTIALGKREAPYAFVIPRSQARAAEAADFVNLLREHGSEIHEAEADFTTVARPPMVERGDQYPDRMDTVRVRRGDWIVRMDQPYTRMARTLLSHQRYKADDPNPYDDTGWSLADLRHVDAYTIADSAILTRPMRMLQDGAAIAGTIEGRGDVLLVPHVGDWRSAALPFHTGNAQVRSASASFRVGNREYPAGTWIVSGDATAARAGIEKLGLRATAVSSAPDVATHTVQRPRIALMHSWLETQNEGWVRFAFDEMEIPYTYISDQDLRNPNALDQFDVVFFEHVRGSTTSLLNGRPMTGPPIPWKTSELTPNLGKIDSTDDIRPGMGLEGASTLRRFLERGGVLIATGNSATLPVHLGFNPGVQQVESDGLIASGAVFRAQPVDRTSPILYGYERQSFPVYFNQAPLLQAGGGFGFGGGGGGAAADTSEEARRARPRVILRFHQDTDSLLVSGRLQNGGELAGKAAVIDAPVGEGHAVLFAIRPVWRHSSQGSFALALNAITHWNNLQAAPRQAGGRTAQQ
jgi:hypothetical protein